jgi:hypothetical protein
MDKQEQYKALFTDIIAKQVVILGPDIAILKARNVKELTIDEQGVVTEIVGDPKQSMEKLIDEYVGLSGAIVKATLAPIFAKYPTLGESDEK